MSSVTRPPRACSHPTGCSSNALAGNTLCEAHAARKNHARYSSREQAAYRSKSYKRAREQMILKYGKQCWTCHKHHRVGNPITCHHIDGDNENNEVNNLALLCRRCHSTLEREIDFGQTDGQIREALAEALTLRGGFFKSDFPSIAPYLSSHSRKF